MKYTGRKTLAMLLVLVMLCSLLPTFALAADEPTQIVFSDGTYSITTGGSYQLPSGTGGTVKVNTTSAVTIIGNGATWDSTFAMTSTPNVALYFDCTNQAGVNLTLKDCYITNKASITCADSSGCGIAGFAGTDNDLKFEGVNVLEYEIGGDSNPAAIHVNSTAALTVGGSGTLYFYKSAQGSGFGGNTGELNGSITFEDLTMFAKGTKQGALIGAGSKSANAVGLPGTITFNSGSYNLISNSRGAAIGGSAGSNGASSGTTVYVNGGDININADYSGAAVGGGGYAEGNDSSGGIIYISGGSLRVYTDKNAAKNVATGWNGQTLVEGISDLPITAQRLNNSTEKENVYRCAVDTAAIAANSTGDDYVVYVDDGQTPFFSGSRHMYGYVQEGLDKSLGEQLSITTTPSNWYLNGETNLYLYLTGENHTVTVNGYEMNYIWDESTKSFKLKGWDGGLDFSWYDATNVSDEYHITTPEQLAALAWICSEHLDDLATANAAGLGAGTYTNGNVTAITGTIPTTQNTFTGVKFYLDNDIDMGGLYNSTTKTWSGPNYYPIGSQALDDNGTSNFYGLFYGSFDGQGHIVSNIYCDRGTGSAWQSAGLFGRVGAADNTTFPATNIVIENVAVTGYIKSGRSVGGIVGKTLHVADGYTVTVQNCLNFADITSSDAKGTGGIVGAAWNASILNNCANFGTVIANYKNGGGISGSFECSSENCYNVGDISKSKARPPEPLTQPLVYKQPICQEDSHDIRAAEK